MSRSPKFLEAFELLKHSPYTLEQLIKLNELQESANAEDAKRIGNLWEVAFFSSPAEVIVQYDEYLANRAKK